MAEFNYGLGFYLVELGDSYYDLYNSATDKCILAGELEENVVRFLELNQPAHPFLYQDNKESDYYSYNFTTDDNGSTTVTNNSYYNTYYGASTDPNITSQNNSFYSSFDYTNADYCSGLSEEDLEEEYDPVQLEFEFSYKGKDIEKDKTPNVSSLIMDEDIPYLPDYED